MVQVSRKYCACNVQCIFLLANKTLASPKGLHPVGLLSNYFSPIFKIYCVCVCVCIYIHTYIHIHIISELHFFEGQSNIPMHFQYGSFCVKSNRNRCVFAWRHLEAGHYVAQSGLHLHQSEPHSCK